jgi:DNA polymerase (family 10)
VNNLTISWIFLEIADLLQIKGDNPFKIRSYRQAARLLRTLDRDVRYYWENNLLQELPGIGAALAEKINELFETGTMAYLNQLRQEVPIRLRQLLLVPGLGPRTVNRIYQRLHVTSVQQLKVAVANKKLRSLPGLGVKSEQEIERGLQTIEFVPEGLSLGDAFTIASDLSQLLVQLPHVSRVEIAGQIRRREELIQEALFLLTAPWDQAAGILATFGSALYVREILQSNPTEIAVQLGIGLKVRLIIVNPVEFYTQICYYTGPIGHWKALVKQARQTGLELTPSYLKDGTDFVSLRSEQDLYCYLGLEFVIPELRAGGDEVVAAQHGTLPNVISLQQVKGDLHLHTDWSDGKESILSMAKAALNRGYQYIAITDHSQRLKIARGLDARRLAAQVDEIASVRKTFPDLTILTGIEVDILSDGSLDLPDWVLAKLDLVVAAVHSGFKQDKITMTKRIVVALRNPYVHILAHPSGRLIGKRLPYQVNLDTVLIEAQRQGKIMEINASPERLDLDTNWAAKAKSVGVKLVINTDAHDSSCLADMKYGVSVARRAGLGTNHVINTWPVTHLRKVLQSIRGET